MDSISWKNKDTTVLQLLESWVIKTPNRRALVFEPGVSATFKEMWELSGKIYAYLKSRGIKAEDVVMYCLPRGIELFACMIGTMRAGAAFVLTETGNDKRTEFISKDCRCKLYVDESDWNNIIQKEPLEGYEQIRPHSLFLENTICYNCYASTESGCLLTIFKLPCKMNPAPVGKSQSDVSVFILDEDDMEVSEGTLGEVCYRNPYVRGYINLPEKTQGLIRGGISLR